MVVIDRKRSAAHRSLVLENKYSFSTLSEDDCQSARCHISEDSESSYCSESSCTCNFDGLNGSASLLRTLDHKGTPALVVVAQNTRSIVDAARDKKKLLLEQASFSASTIEEKSCCHENVGKTCPSTAKTNTIYHAEDRSEAVLVDILHILKGEHHLVGRDCVGSSNHGRFSFSFELDEEVLQQKLLIFLRLPRVAQYSSLFRVVMKESANSSFNYSDILKRVEELEDSKVAKLLKEFFTMYEKLCCVLKDTQQNDVPATPFFKPILKILQRLNARLAAPQYTEV